ncbi:DUF3253 domain-containing protein [Variovorax sp. Varisp41]|jgi:uncharacterized phage protein gp47/JayE|uniref:DUF3253 domain-containing protein n=1 Tax=unclassified Variovorax TaxID=663243 RepID=UPI000C557F24|nr:MULTISPECIES: DUF3253 domain-containing protein [unclassified Variovorax]MBS79664.1 hypothetical protein [Variovorax sp.]MCT8177053.1 DUF3253 domain-containing protein [Variovorax sp. CY25R-8]
MSVASRTVVTNEAVEAEIFELLARRAPGASICPSEVARALASAPSDWRALMPQVREVAQELALRRRLLVTRKGARVEAMGQGGPIRLSLLFEKERK